MERISEPCGDEFIKNTMLRHEDIFKQQVRELHRLYGVQTMLMTEQRCEESAKKKKRKKKMMMKSSFAHSSRPCIIMTEAINKLQSSGTSSETTHSSHASVRNNNNNNAAAKNSEHASGHPEPFRTPSSGYVLRDPVEGESPESCSNGECDLDLTLSIGRGEAARGSSRQPLTSNLDREGSGKKDCTNSSTRFGAASLKRPHWLFQPLSLHRT